MSFRVGTWGSTMLRVGRQSRRSSRRQWRDPGEDKKALSKNQDAPRRTSVDPRVERDTCRQSELQDLGASRAGRVVWRDQESFGEAGQLRHGATDKERWDVSAEKKKWRSPPLGWPLMRVLGGGSKAQPELLPVQLSDASSIQGIGPGTGGVGPGRPPGFGQCHGEVPVAISRHKPGEGGIHRHRLSGLFAAAASSAAKVPIKAALGLGLAARTTGSGDHCEKLGVTAEGARVQSIWR